MSVKQRIYYVLHSIVVVGLVVDTVWRWRKGIYWFVGLLWVYRVLLVATIVSAAVFAPLSSVQAADPNPYPGGARDPTKWYYCYASVYNPTVGSFSGLNWTPFTCETLLWQMPSGGGGAALADSVLFEASVTADGGGAAGEAARIRSMIIPARGIQYYQYTCNSFVSVCNNGVGSVSSQVNTVGATGFSSASGWSIINVPAAVGTCEGDTLNVATDRIADTYDRLWSPDYVGSFTSGTTSFPSQFPYFNAEALTTNGNRNASAGYSCTITAWGSWPQWLATNPEWVPDVDDQIDPPATPTPVPGEFGEWVMEPWFPITDTSNFPVFDIGPGEDGGCEMIIPQQSIEIGGNEYGWYGFEVCRTDYSMTLGLFGEDFNALLNVALSIGGLAIVYSIFKRG